MIKRSRRKRRLRAERRAVRYSTRRRRRIRRPFRGRRVRTQRRSARSSVRKRRRIRRPLRSRRVRVRRRSVRSSVHRRRRVRRPIRSRRFRPQRATRRSAVRRRRRFWWPTRFRRRLRTGRIRVLLLIDKFNIGGTETHVLSLARELMAMGVYVVIAGKKGRLLHEFRKLGCRIYALRNRISYKNNGYRILRRIVRRERINLVHAHQSPSGSIAYRVAKRMNIPYVFTVHGTYCKMKFIRSIRRHAKIISVSPALQRNVRRVGVHSTLIPNGINLAEYPEEIDDSLQRSLTRERLGIPQDAILLLYASRLSSIKGPLCEKIINAVADLSREYPDLHLLVAGGGEYEGVIKRKIRRIHRRSRKKYIHHVGQVLNIRDLYKASDCVVGTGRVALEAMASGRPTISFGRLGLLGLIDPGNFEKGWECWYGDHQRIRPYSRRVLKSHLRRILHMNEGERSNLVFINRTLIKKRFESQKVAQQIMNLYRSL